MINILGLKDTVFSVTYQMENSVNYDVIDQLKYPYALKLETEILFKNVSPKQLMAISISVELQKL